MQASHNPLIRCKAGGHLEPVFLYFVIDLPSRVVIRVGRQSLVWGHSLAREIQSPEEPLGLLDSEAVIDPSLCLWWQASA